MEQSRHHQSARNKCLWLVFLAIVCGGEAADGITIRHDTPDQAYIDLAADPRFASFGFFRAPGTCSWSGGTLIHPEWVLTAAHCIPGSSQTGVQFSLGPATGDFVKTVAAESWLKNSNFNINDAGAGGDFGLVHLQEPILDVTPARRYRGAAERTNVATVLGYGYTGTGLTGQTTAGLGTKRASDNMGDFFGGAVGVSTKLIVTDFDNPDNPADSQFGSSTPLDLEGAVALYDSGGAWFMNIDGIDFLVGVTSFRMDRDNSNDVDSDYKDISAGGRVSRDAVWIDGHADITLFWNGGSGDWHTSNKWDANQTPGAALAAVIDDGEVSLTLSDAQAEYVFLQATGALTLANDLTADYLIQQDASSLQLDGVHTLVGAYRQRGGSLAIDIAGTLPGQADRLVVDGLAEISSHLDINNDGSYRDPATPGDEDIFTVLTATDIEGTFDAVTYDGQMIETGQQFVGTTQTGRDGLFRTLEYSDTEVTITNYLALPGDANGDGGVDVTDFNIWNTNKFTGSTDWTTGDFTGDGFTDVSDFNIWNTNRFTSAADAAPSFVPEPSALSGVAIALVSLLLHGRARLREH